MTTLAFSCVLYAGLADLVAGVVTNGGELDVVICGGWRDREHAAAHRPCRHHRACFFADGLWYDKLLYLFSCLRCHQVCWTKCWQCWTKCWQRLECSCDCGPRLAALLCDVGCLDGVQHCSGVVGGWQHAGHLVSTDTGANHYAGCMPYVVRALSVDSTLSLIYISLLKK